jgi:hypothetical protein
MSVDWFVPALAVDFDDDPEDMLIDYIFSKWSILNPAKGATKRDNSNRDFIKFHTGYFDYMKAYEIAITSENTTPDPSVDPVPPRYNYFITRLNIQVRMQRLPTSPESISDEIGNMEREVGRIVRNYRPNDILGIEKLYITDSFRPTSLNNEYAPSNWTSNCYARVEYWKYNTKEPT